MYKEALKTRNGDDAKNQFKVHKDDGVYFESYGTIIAKRGTRGHITLDMCYWDYSITTLQYLKQFLGLEDSTTAEIQSRIDSEMYKTANFNKS